MNTFTEENMPMIPIKNVRGYYPLTVRLGEDYQSLIQNNPNLLIHNESGIGPGFIYPNLKFKDILDIDVTLLNADMNPIFKMNGFQDVGLVNDSMGINHLNLALLTSGANGQELDLQTRYQQYIAVMMVLKKYGWKHFIPKDQPRISGLESWQLMAQENIYNPDGYYIDSFEKWQKYIGLIEGPTMSFYKDNLILTFHTFDSSPSLIFDMYTAQFLYLYLYDEKNKLSQWKAHLVEDVPQWKKERIEIEMDLRKKGFHIDENYIDAPLPIQ